MPGVRKSNKNLASFWMHADIYAALATVAKLTETTQTRFILEALAVKMGFQLDEESNPIGLDLGKLARQAVARRKRKPRKKRCE